jgi:hypothetical protein
MTEHARNSLVSETGSAQKVLFELQVEQHHHDEVYHREIARLSLHHRLNHMALHFAKYAGKVAASSSIAETIPVMVDTLIIALSTANTLNINLWDHVQTGDVNYPGLVPFGRTLALTISDDISSVPSLTRSLAISAGRIAAACEKIDHLEEISFRGEMRSGVVTLSKIALALLVMQSIDPALAVRERLNGVKQRLKLHGRI